MPTRRTSPRRTATRPSVPFAVSERRDPDDDDGPPPGRLAAAAPWLAIGAAAIAIAALAVTLFGRGTDMDACRNAAWAATPDEHNLPTGWTLSSTDLNANGMTVSILGQASADGTSDQPVVYASVTCYGDVAQTAMSQYRTAAKAANAKVTDRGLGGDAYDVSNPATGSVTTLFRVGGLIGQIADGGSVGATDLADITIAVATAMGDEGAAGTRTAGANPSDAAAASDQPSDEPVGSDETGATPATAPELEAHLPTEVSGTPLTIQSGGASDYLPQDPSSGALTAALRRDGITLADLQVAQAYDETQSLDLNVIGFRLTKGDVAKLRTAVLSSWLSGTAPGVKQTAVHLAGKTFTKVDYGTGRNDYVYRGTDYVIVIETSDANLATEVAAGLK
jgi:hypothetical protein